MVVAAQREAPAARRFALHPWSLAVISIGVAAVFKQVAVNISGDDRHAVAGTIELFSLGAGVGSAIQQLIRPRHSWVPVVIAVQAFGLITWILLAVAGPSDASSPDRLVALVSDIGFTLLVWVPFTLRAPELCFARNIVLLIVLCSAAIGILQFFLPVEQMPGLLQPDSTVYLSMTAIGTIRVNGLIGNPIEFAALMTAFAVMSYVRIRSKPGLVPVVALGVFLVAIALAGSRAAWLAAAALLVLVTPARKLPLLIVPALGLALLTLTVLPQGYWTAYFDAPRVYLESDSQRIWEMNAALGLAGAHPLYGLGVGTQLGFTSSKLITDGYWLSLLLEGGYIGMLSTVFSLLALAALIVRTDRNRLVTMPQSVIREHRAAAAALLLLLGFEGLINSFITNQSVAVLFYLSLGYCLRLCAPDGYAAGVGLRP